ncbi:hypothetical protein WOLCODRAFT_139805 [Wolfiporia cocos MD-104 SS10]|uniref:Pentacotripeptide-repeat region of PRORP domain-containing protein n=1 Tax=Wolfiporia cocos (strain MD-104) TaxID=742152 RepID=A0A2H3JGT8_WOLCO|nr:hypothetical protein WOLCODRAFT_139805 [Wolfiporia cocos MD-104 SS10]
MKRTAYPTDAPDTSMFEEMSADYVAVKLRLSPADTTQPALSGCSLLESLVRDGQYADADRIHAELVEMGIAIEPSMVYENAAIYALTQEHRDPQERLAAFTRWWSLIPNAEASYEPPVRRIEAILLQGLKPDLPLMTQYALICARKGLATWLGTRIMSVIFRYSAPAQTSSFLETLCDTALQATWDCELSQKQLWRRNWRDWNRRRSLEHRLLRRMDTWYTWATISFVTNGRIEDAIRVLQQAQRRGLRLSDKAYDAVMRQLERSLDLEGLALVKQLYQDRPPVHLYSMNAIPEIESTFRQYKPPDELTQTMFSDEKSLAKALRIMRRNIIPSHFPLPSALARFMAEYRARGRSIGLQILRKKAYEKPATMSMWVLAEMLYHTQRGERNRVMEIYAHHFFTVGLPEYAEQNLWFLSEQKNRAQALSSSDDLYLLPPVEAKTWPSTHHTAVVWKAVAASAKRAEPLELLYSELLRKVTNARAMNAACHWSPEEVIARSTEYPSAAAPATLYDVGHFNVFVYEFAEHVGPARAAKVVADMYRYGIAPTVETLTMLGSSFARCADVKKIYALLDQMENSTEQRPIIEDESLAARVATQQRKSLALPSPNIITYTAIMRFLINRKHGEIALQIARRMQQNLGYIPGTNPYTDEVLLQLAEYAFTTDRKEH